MSHYIPRHGRAGIAAMGVELRDAWPFLVSLAIGLISIMMIHSLTFGLVLPAGVWFITREWVRWKKNRQPGFFHSVLYALGVPLGGYSSALDQQNKRFVGDNQVGCPRRQTFLLREVSRESERAN